MNTHIHMVFVDDTKREEMTHCCNCCCGSYIQINPSQIKQCGSVSPARTKQLKEIEVRGAWVLGYSYPVAGDPSIGFLALSIGALFVFISSLAMGYTKDGGRLAGCSILCATICALLSSLVIFVKSFGERAGEGLLL